MAAQKQSKVITKRRKFIEVNIPLIRSKIEIAANSPKDLEGRNAKIDLTRQLKGKSVEAVMKVVLENDKPVAHPIKVKLMPYFIRRMIRKRISYVEDSFLAKSQNSLLIVKPFLITRNKVSRSVRKTLRNKSKNWLEDYIKERTDDEIFNDVLSNRMQKPLSLYLKKTYPLSLCEIRILELVRPLKPEEVPKIEKKIHIEPIIEEKEEFIDQMKEIEDELVKKAENEIKQAQEKASKIEKDKSEENKDEKEEKKEEVEKEEIAQEKPKRGRKKKIENSEEKKEEEKIKPIKEKKTKEKTEKSEEKKEREKSE
ncbi:MAG: hypothetical protein Q8N99_05900 [Nanoarchaeota archaeon]|nr:hypothetical protein [Nanoarchaeota archaeon]